MIAGDNATRHTPLIFRAFGFQPTDSERLFVRFRLRDYTGRPCTEALPLAKPNYSFEKRQREIAKKKEKDEKDARKREARDAAKQAAGSGEATSDDSDTPPAAG